MSPKKSDGLGLQRFVSASIGFFDLAIAAPSMKAAPEIWAPTATSFIRDLRGKRKIPVVAATIEHSGIVLRRPLGTSGASTKTAELPNGSRGRHGLAHRRSPPQKFVIPS